jgi:hypothetical protein
MKKEKSMIITFKIFEAISNEGLKPAYLMTLTEYKAKITPIIKSFYKFISKNTDYFKKSDYYGLIYLTWDEYIEKERIEWENKKKDKWEEGKDWESSWHKKYIEEQWMDHKPIPQDVKKTYEDYLTVFTQIFENENLSKVETDEVGSNKRSVRRAFDDGTYVDLIKENKLEYDKFEEIVTSVGLKIPTGFNKKINYKPKVAKKADDEKELIFVKIKQILNYFVKNKVNAWDLAPRKTKDMYRVSFSNITSFKYIVDNFNFLDSEQKSEIEETEEYKDYMNRAKTYILKAEEKNMDFADDSVYTKIIAETKIKIQPTIDEHKQEIKEKILNQQKEIKKQKSELSEDDFIKKYGEKITDRKGNFVNYSMYKFEQSVLNGLLEWSKDQTDVYIKQQQDMYQENEHNKLAFLFVKLKMRFPNITEFEFGDVEKRRTGIEFLINGFDKDGVIYEIHTNTIFAGGYNIQVYHMRWLMSVLVNGKQVAAFKSES